MVYHKVYDPSHSYLSEKEDNNVEYTSNPLGQEAKITGSVPEEKASNLISGSKQIVIIKRVQLTLLLSGYYDGKIDGTLNSKTLESISVYKNAHNILEINSESLDTQTLISLGVFTND